jgi:type II secretory pathway pseudopilin PulG
VRSPERGITIFEVTVVIVLASVVMMGLVGFYLNSQATWIEASTQALTQRDATLALERMTERIRGASSAVTPDSSTLVLYDLGGNELRRFWLEPSDSLLHHGLGTIQDDGPLVDSKVERFRVSADPAFVTIGALVLAGPRGTRIEAASGATLYNRP